MNDASSAPRRGVFEVDVDRALAALRATWGEAYAVCYDGAVPAPFRWQAWRLGQSARLAGGTPDELSAAIRADLAAGGTR